MFTAEGVKIITELLNSDFQIAVIYCTEKHLAAIAPGIIKKNIRLELVTEQELHQISYLENNSTALALVHIPDQHKIMLSPNETVLILDGINDPGNFGTIIRTADWFGIKQVICSENTVDLYNSKVIASSMGSFAHVKVTYGSLKDLISALQFKTVYGTFLSGNPLPTLDCTSSGTIAIIMGSESHGIDKELEPFITHRITIPGQGKAESLNVGVSCGIVLYECLGRKS